MEKIEKVESAKEKKPRAAKATSSSKKATKAKTIVKEKKEKTIKTAVVGEEKEIKKTKANSAKDPVNVKEAIEAKVDAFFEAAKNENPSLRKLVSATKLMEAGSHIGMPARFWNPKMKPFVYNKRNGKGQVIDVLTTLVFLNRAYNFIKDITKEGGRVLFVGTRKDIIKEHVKSEAKRVKSFYVNQRWLGGTITNFKTISKSIDKLNKLIALQLSDEIKKYTKKEQVAINKQTEKLMKFFGGIRTMRQKPDVIVVTDPIAEKNAIQEARKAKIPVVAIANTNADPSLVDFIIPANNSSIKTVYLIISILADAIAEARGETLSVVGKTNEEIILPEVAKKVTEEVVRHKKFDRFADSNAETAEFENETSKTE